MIPTRPSRTALVVAKSLALVGMSPETARLVPPEARRFVKTALQITGYQRFAAGLRHPWFRNLVRLYERLMIPGLAVHHALRKHMVENIVRRELTDGATQIVQIGAGFDSLCHRLHRQLPSARFTELDHPDTQQSKRMVLDSIEAAEGSLTLQPVDLSQPDASPSLPSAQRTVVIIEGVLMYLEPGTVQQLLRNIRRQISAHSLLLFSFMASPGFLRQSPLVSWWLRAGGEPFRWSLPPRDLPAFLQETGFAPARIHSTANHELAQDLHPARGELLCEARPHTPDHHP